MSRILVIEDDPAILCGLKANLEFESHQVLTATDGETDTACFARILPIWSFST